MCLAESQTSITSDGIRNKYLFMTNEFCMQKTYSINIATLRQPKRKIQVYWMKKKRKIGGL